MKEEKKVKIKLVRGLAGVCERQRKTITSLGLGKRNSEAEHKLTIDIVGKLKKVGYLLDIQEEKEAK